MGNDGGGYYCGGDCDYDSCEYTWIIMVVIDMTVVVMVMRTVVDPYG